MRSGRGRNGLRFVAAHWPRAWRSISGAIALTESWAAGVPALVTDLGAQADRVRAHGGGFLIRHDNAALALAQVLAAADDPDAYARETARASADGLPGVTDMSDRYRDLYVSVLARRRTLPALDLALA